MSDFKTDPVELVVASAKALMKRAQDLNIINRLRLWRGVVAWTWYRSGK